MIKNLMLVGAGGFLGSILRYWFQLLAIRFFPLAFPWGTLIANLTGCLLIGFLAGFGERNEWFDIQWRLLLMTGLCGGFTTFSTFSYESIALLKEGAILYFFLYVIGSVVLGLICVFAGLTLVKSLLYE